MLGEAGRGIWHERVSTAAEIGKRNEKCVNKNALQKQHIARIHILSERNRQGRSREKASYPSHKSHAVCIRPANGIANIVDGSTCC